MKKNLIFIFLICIGFSCENQPSKAELRREARKEAAIEKATLPLVSESEKGAYKEWYPGREQLKIEGWKNKNGLRDGVWKSYFENGVVRSVLIYENGNREGIYIVRYPNNMIHYRGEYSNDEAIGIWKFYDQEGTLIETKNYDSINKEQ